MTRQLVLDTETTGLDPKEGHRIIEVGVVEMLNRRVTGRHLHFYFNPGRPVDEGAREVHGLTNEFLADKPPFADIAKELLDFIEGAELVIHNAPFDVGFLNHEFNLIPSMRGFALNSHCSVLDTLVLARQLHRGQRNSLDALCKRYKVDNRHRQYHGALLDAGILAEVYLAMTGGQISFALQFDAKSTEESVELATITPQSRRLKIVEASPDEIIAHDAFLKVLGQSQAESWAWSRVNED